MTKTPTPGRRAEPYDFVSRPSCPGCGYVETRTLFSAPFDEGSIAVFIRNYYHVDPALLSTAPYRLDQCSRCSLIFQHFAGSDDLLRDLYTDWVAEPSDPERDIESYRSEIAAIPQSRDAHEMMAAAAHLRLPLGRLKCLDYGMGWALWARIAAALGCDSHGTDLAEPRMDYARAHGVKTIGDADIPGSDFDFINTEQVFEHVLEPLELLRRLAAGLTPGGIVKISVPSGERAEKIIQLLKSGRYMGDYPTIMPVHPLEHVNTFTRRAVSVMAEAAGLRPIRPSLASGYAFLRSAGTISPRRPAKALKELVRPWYQFVNPANIYVWLEKPPR